NAVESHVLEALDRVPTAGAADRIATAGELFVLLGRDAGVAEAGRVEWAQSLTDEEIARLPIQLMDEVWRPVTKLALHARRPQVGRFQDVGICRKRQPDGGSCR